MAGAKCSIRPLPADSQIQLRATVILNSLSDAVIGLVENALDANARTIEVEVDFARGSCSVEDDGDGILSEDFGQDGGLGLMHHTSRFSKFGETYGQCGRFLASLSSLSFMSLSSRHFSEHIESLISFHNGKPLRRQINVPEQDQRLKLNQGTKVLVRDIFGSLPVRSKHWAIHYERQENVVKDYELLKLRIVGIALAWSKQVKYVIKGRNGQQQRKIRIGSRAEPVTSLEAPSFWLERISAILDHASCLPSSNSNQWTRVSAKMSDLFIRAAICFEAFPSKQIQFISIGIRPLESMTSMGKILLREINDLFADSTFGDAEDTFYESRNLGTRVPEHGKTSSSNRRFHVGTKCLDRWPMFYIRIDQRDVDLNQTLSSLEEDDQRTKLLLGRVIQLLRVLIVRSLKEHGFLPENHKETYPTATVVDQNALQTDLPMPVSEVRESTTSDGQNHQPKRRPSEGGRRLSPRNAASVEHHHPHLQIPILLRSRMRSGHFPEANDLGLEPRPAKESDKSQLLERSRHENPEDSLSDVGDPACLDPNEGPIIHGLELTNPGAIPKEGPDPKTCGEDGFITWQDPVSGKDVLINSRTGLLLSDEPSRGHAQSQEAKQVGPKRNCNQGRGLQVAFKPSPGQDPVSSENQLWLNTLLKSQTASTFRIQEKQIPSFEVPETRKIRSINQERTTGASHHCQAPGFLGQDRRLSKAELQNATILGQVDNKFLLAAIVLSKSPEPSGVQYKGGCISLVLIDQHAADERCRVEDLFAELSKSRRVILARPIHVEITAQESELFQRQRTRFENWGTEYCLKTDHVTEPVIQSSVNRPASASQATIRVHGREADRGVSSRARYVQPDVEDGVSGGTKNRTKVTVTTLPEVIAERCRHDPALVINMLRAEAWSDTENGPNNSNSLWLVQGASENESDTAAAHSWLRNISKCPRGIIELLNARACRSAIMFNDTLSHEECVGMLERLARCAFPFQCAHGRPSMVVLGGLDAVGTRNEIGAEVFSDRDDGRSFLQAFTDWQSGCR